MPCCSTNHDRTPRGRYRGRFRGGLTLVELLLSLAITALIAGAVAGMLSGVAYGTDEDRDVRKLVAREAMVSARLEAAARGSRMVLDHGSGPDGTWFVLWSRDLDENDLPSLREIRLIEHDAAGGFLASYEAGDTAADTAYTLADDFDAITNALRGTADFPEERWGPDVTGFEIALDEASPQSARRLSYRVTLSGAHLDHVVVGTARLRNAP